MSQFILDLFFASVFALILLLLTKIRDKTFLGNLDSYRYSYAGVAVLCFVSFLQMAGHQGLLYGIPFISEEIYRNLIEATGIVAGVTMLLAGVSFWLPSKRISAGKAATEPSVRAEIINCLEQTHEANLLFLRFLEIICRKFGFQGFALFRYSSHKKRFLCTNRNGLNQNIEPALRDYSFTRENSENALKEIAGRFKFEYVLPIYISDKLGVLACLQGGSHVGLSNEELGTLHDAGSLLSWRLTSDYFRLKGTYEASRREFRRGLAELLSADTSIKKNLPGLYRLCRDYLGTEYLALAWAEGAGQDFRSYSVGINGNILQNDSPAPMPRGSLGARIISEKKAAVIDDLNRNDDIMAEPLARSCGQRSLLGIPVVIDGRIGAILTLGSPRPKHFRARRRFMAGGFAEVITGSIIAEQGRHRAALLATCLESLKRTYSYLDEVPSPQDLFAKIAEEILTSVKTTLVRIFLLHKGNSRLDCVAFKTIRAIDEKGFADNVVIDGNNLRQLETLYEGRMVIEDYLAGPSDSRRSAGRLFLAPGIKSSLIIPIINRGLFLGVIALGETRHSGRYNYDVNIQEYCYGMAQALNQGIKQYHAAQAIMAISPNIPGLSEIPDIPPLTNRLRTNPMRTALKDETASGAGAFAFILSERFADDPLKEKKLKASAEES